MEIPQYIRLHRVAKRLDIDSASLLDMSRKGMFPPVIRTGIRMWAVERDAVLAWIEAGGNVGEAS